MCEESPSAPDSYLAIVLKFPLASIRNSRHLAEAQKMLDKLLARGKLNKGREQYLDALTDLVEHYEEKCCPLPEVDDVAVLFHLLEARGVSQQELAQATGVPKSTISEILSRKRSMTRPHVALFARFFRVGQGAFALAE